MKVPEGTTNTGNLFMLDNYSRVLMPWKDTANTYREIKRCTNLLICIHNAQEENNVAVFS